MWKHMFAKLLQRRKKDANIGSARLRDHIAGQQDHLFDLPHLLRSGKVGVRWLQNKRIASARNSRQRIDRFFPPIPYGDLNKCGSERRILLT